PNPAAAPAWLAAALAAARDRTTDIILTAPCWWLRPLDFQTAITPRPAVRRGSRAARAKGGGVRRRTAHRGRAPPAKARRNRRAGSLPKPKGRGRPIRLDAATVSR